MAVKVLMPKLGLTMTEGKIVRWLKQEGDPVKKGEPLLEVMTEKIVTEVESPGAGTLVKIFRAVEEVIPVTEVIALIAADGEDWKAVAAEVGSPEEPAVKEPAPEKPKAAASPPAAVSRESGERLKVSPLARRIAAENGLTGDDLFAIAGTGPGGRIVKKDILLYLEQEAKKPIPAPAPAAGGRVEPLTDLRSAIARRMTQSFTTTPHFYLEVEVDAENMLELRRRINETLSKHGESVSINDLLIKTTATVLAWHPPVNSSYSEQGITIHDQVNLGVAVALDSGLIVPVIRDAARKGLREIAATGRALIEKARAGSLALDDITGGTFTLSNLGMFAVDSFTAIINPPEAAILAVGRIVEKPVSVDGNIVSGKRMRLTLSLDHRVVDGAQGARFLGDLVEHIENPMLLL